MTTCGRIHSLCRSARRGEPKQPVPELTFVSGFGIAGDAHAGSERQVSLLPYEAFAEVAEQVPGLSPGAFAENLTTVGLDFGRFVPGARLRLGEAVVLEITHIGKTCHAPCAIQAVTGDCIMPRLGVFARVVAGGTVHAGDPVWYSDEV